MRSVTLENSTGRTVSASLSAANKHRLGRWNDGRVMREFGREFRRLLTQTVTPILEAPSYRTMAAALIAGEPVNNSHFR